MLPFSSFRLYKLEHGLSDAERRQQDISAAELASVLARIGGCMMAVVRLPQGLARTLRRVGGVSTRHALMG